jgi:hypothetical protein
VGDGQQLALVWARTVVGGPSLDWTLHVLVPSAHVQVRSVCARLPPVAFPARPWRQCWYATAAAATTTAAATAQALASAARALKLPPPPMPVFFVTAVAGRRTRLEHMLWLHRRNAMRNHDGALARDGTASHVCCQPDGACAPRSVWSMHRYL